MSMEQGVKDTVADNVNERIELALLRKAMGELPWVMQDSAVIPEQKLSVLVGEVGEVGQAVQARYKGTPRGNLESELLDVASCVIQWLYAIESRRRRRGKRNG